MTNENDPVAEEGNTDSQPSHAPMVAVDEAAQSETPSTAQIAAEPPEIAEVAAGSETEREQEPPATKSGKKPRKSTKATPSASPAAETPETSTSPSTPVAESSPESTKKWYVVKVQSGREDSIKAAIERKVKIEGLEEFFGQIAIPVEEIIQKKSVRVTDKKTGDKVTQEKKVIKHQKKFPGYLFAEVDYNDRILYLFRETSGVGDFVGASLKREPTPMTDREVRAMLTGVVDGDPGKPNQKQQVKLDYEKGDKVKIRDGAFANMEGIVKSITDTKDTGETPKVEVEVHIFGRPVQVVLDYWHVDKA
jgi:transcriptional antiterminator NusG